MDVDRYIARAVERVCGTAETVADVEPWRLLAVYAILWAIACGVFTLAVIDVAGK